MAPSHSKLTPSSRNNLNDTFLVVGTPQDGNSVPSSILHMEQGMLEQLTSSPDKSAGFLQEPLPPGLEKILTDILEATPQVLHLFVVNHLTTLRSIAQFGDRPLPVIFADFPIRTVLHPAFHAFMVAVRTLTLHVKHVAQAEMTTDTPLQVENPDTILNIFLMRQKKLMNFAPSSLPMPLNIAVVLVFVGGPQLLKNKLN